MTGGSIKSRLSFASGEEDNIKKIAEQISEYEGRRKSAVKNLKHWKNIFPGSSQNLLVLI